MDPFAKILTMGKKSFRNHTHTSEWLLLFTYCSKTTKKIFNFWEKVSQELCLFLMNLSGEGLSLTSVQWKLLNKFLPLERRCILFQWIKPRPPTGNQCCGENFKVLTMERLSPVLKGNERVFDKLWLPFLNYLQNCTQGPLYCELATLQFPRECLIPSPGCFTALL